MKPIVKIWVLSQHAVEKFRGTEVECLRYLQTAQPYSDQWAFIHDGWELKEVTIDPNEEEVSHDL